MKANENQSAARKALLLRGWEALCQPLVAIIFGLVVGAVVILACGQNPMAVYAELFEKSFIKARWSRARWWRRWWRCFCPVRRCWWP